MHVLYNSVISDSLLYDITTLVHGFRCVLNYDSPFPGSIYTCLASLFENLSRVSEYALWEFSPLPGWASMTAHPLKLGL